MAKRRWSTGKRLAYGFSEGAGNFLDGLMRSRLADKQAERIAQRQEEADIRTASRQESASRRAEDVANRRLVVEQLPKISSGEMQPNALTAMMDAMGMGGMFPSEFDVDYAGTGEVQHEVVANAQATGQALEGLRPPMRRKLESSVGKFIGDATTPEALNQSDIMGQILAADDRVTPPEDEPGMRIGGIRPEAYEYVARAQDKADELRAKPDQRVSGVNDDGSTFDQMMSAYDMTEPVTTGLTSEAKGTQEGKQEVAKETATLDPKFQAFKTRTLANMANLSEALTRQAKIDTAVGTAKGVAQAQADVRYDPANVEQEVALERAKNPTVDKTTESERRASANWMPLVNAHANALSKEAEGVRLTPFAIEATSTPFYQAILGGQVDKQTQEYVQSARDFVSTLGYIRSGVAVRPDEVNTFIYTMFGYEGESPAQVAQKVQSREIMLGAMQAMVGRSAPEAARVLAAAINNGQIPAALLSRLEIRPEIAKAMLPLLTGVAQFDTNGNVIGVRPQ